MSDGKVVLTERDNIGGMATVRKVKNGYIVNYEIPGLYLALDEYAQTMKDARRTIDYLRRDGLTWL